MFKIQHNQNKIFNSKLPLFFVFCACGFCYLSINVSCWYLILVVLLPFAFNSFKLHWSQWLIAGLIIIVFIFLCIFAKDFSIINLINKLFDSWNGHFVRKGLIIFWDKVYEPEIASFIKLIILNVKTNETYIFYKQIVDLGIVWLFFISGFQISLLKRIIKFIFHKHNKVGWYVSIATIGLYSYILNFSYSSIRILMGLCLQPFFQKFKMDKYNQLGFIGLSICFINPVCFVSYGFLLTFIICIGTYFVNSWNLNNKIIQSITINVTSFILTIPFVVIMNNKISLLTFINAFLFRYFASFLFLYFLLFSWLPFMSIIHWGIIVFTYTIIGNISISNIYIYCKAWERWVNVIYYIAFCLIYKLLYLIVKNNKI